MRTSLTRKRKHFAKFYGFIQFMNRFIVKGKQGESIRAINGLIEVTKKETKSL